jgi:hypothetical protein
VPDRSCLIFLIKKAAVVIPGISKKSYWRCCSLLKGFQVYILSFKRLWIERSLFQGRIEFFFPPVVPISHDFDRMIVNMLESSFYLIIHKLLDWFHHLSYPKISQIPQANSAAWHGDLTTHNRGVSTTHPIPFRHFLQLSTHRRTLTTIDWKKKRKRVWRCTAQTRIF